jgi:hypothetical protein
MVSLNAMHAVRGRGLSPFETPASAAPPPPAVDLPALHGKALRIETKSLIADNTVLYSTSAWTATAGARPAAAPAAPPPRTTTESRSLCVASSAAAHPSGAISSTETDRFPSCCCRPFDPPKVSSLHCASGACPRGHGAAAPSHSSLHDVVLQLLLPPPALVAQPSERSTLLRLRKSNLTPDTTSYKFACEFGGYLCSSVCVYFARAKLYKHKGGGGG